MKLGSVKGKIVAGALAVGVVSSVGLAFANTDAGEQLRSWYDGSFGETVDSVEAQVTEYGEGLIPDLQDDYNLMKGKAVFDIDNTRKSETSSAEDAITTAKDSHLEALGSTKDEILAGMEHQFYQDVFLTGYFEIQTLANEAQAYATNDLTGYTGRIGEANLFILNRDLNNAKDHAVSELEAAIESAKGDLEAELDNQEEIAVRNLNNQINFAIRDVRGAVEEILAGLVEEQQAILASAADDREVEAMDALDEVVSGIDK